VAYVRNAHVSGLSRAFGLSQGFVFFLEKRFAFRRSAVLHITGDGNSGARRKAPALPLSMKGNPVAQKVQVLLVDDLDGGEADETVTFALDGKQYLLICAGGHQPAGEQPLGDYVVAFSL